MTKLPILEYHEVITETRRRELSTRLIPAYIVNHEQFEKQMSYLHDNGFSSISLWQFHDYLKDRTDIHPKSIIITFDDGFRGNYDYCLPILVKFGFTATFFITVNKIGSEGMMTWEQIREMSSQKMSIQSHTCTHPLLTTLKNKDLEYELFASKDIIQKQLGSPVRFISFPNGNYNNKVISHAMKYGYIGACTSNRGLNSKQTNPFRLNRVMVSGSYPLSTFSDIVTLNNRFYLNLRTKYVLLRIAKNIMGRKTYLKIWTTIFRIEG